MSRFFYLQGLQRENVWRIGKGLKGREILRFAQYDINTQGAVHHRRVSLPETNTVCRLAIRLLNIWRCNDIGFSPINNLMYFFAFCKYTKLNACFADYACFFCAWVVFVYNNGQRVVVASPYADGGGHYAVVVVALDTRKN